MGGNQRERLWMFGGAIVAFLMILVGYFFFISPQKGQTSAAQSQVSEARAHNAALNQRIRTLEQQNKNLASYVQQLKEAKLALPDSSGLPDFLRTLQSLGNSTLATVTALTVGTPVDATVGAASAPASTSTKTGTTSPPTTGTGGSAAAAAGKVYALPITANVTGSYAQLDQFLSQLQSVQPRAVLISEITETNNAVSGTKGYTLELSMMAFVAPSNATEAAVLSQAAK